MKKGWWHYGYWNHFGDLVYGNTLNNSHLLEGGRVHQQEKFYEINDRGEVDFLLNLPTEFTFYTKMSLGSEKYIVPRHFLEFLPFNMKDYTEVRLKPSDTQVWKLIKEVKSLAIPEKQSGSLKQFLQKWNPMAHSDLKSWYLLKMISLCQGLKLGVCSEVSCGKNANLTLRRHIDRKTLPKVKAPTKAMLYSEMYYNDYINLDEVTSWSKTIIGDIEDMIAEFGDESPDMQKYAKDKNKNLELMNNILYKSLTFTFNPYNETDNPYTFEEKFRNSGKIKDRYPILYLQGKVLDAIPKPSSHSADMVVKENLDEYRSLASEFMYWRNNYNKHLHNYDRSRLKFYRRHLSNINPLIDVLDVFSDTQEEFDSWVEFVNERRDAYNDKTFVQTDAEIALKEEKVE